MCEDDEDSDDHDEDHHDRVPWHWGCEGVAAEAGRAHRDAAGHLEYQDDEDGSNTLLLTVDALMRDFASLVQELTLVSFWYYVS